MITPSSTSGQNNSHINNKIHMLIFKVLNDYPTAKFLQLLHGKLHISDVIFFTKNMEQIMLLSVCQLSLVNRSCPCKIQHHNLT